MSDPALPSDDVDSLLAPSPGTGSRPDLRDIVFRQTERALHRGRWLRRVAKAGVIAAVFAAGGLVGWGVKPERVTVETITPPSEVVCVPVVVPVVIESPSAPADPVAKTPSPVTLSAAAAELQAEQADAPGEAARLYRLAGDTYLNDLQDYRNAIRCYRLFLDRVGDTGLSPDPADTWLLTSLKNAAFKEKFHVAKTDS
jgi:hypothetical protein